MADTGPLDIRSPAQLRAMQAGMPGPGQNEQASAAAPAAPDGSNNGGWHWSGPFTISEQIGPLVSPSSEGEAVAPAVAKPQLDGSKKSAPKAQGGTGRRVASISPHIGP